MEKITVDDKELEAVRVQTSHANILMIKSQTGFLGCGYFDIETANKLEEPVAIVTGVKDFQDMLNAKVIKLSKAAEEMGLSLGISGKEALSLLN
jgi:uncharacterized protein YunC (DUF1805 family)